MRAHRRLVLAGAVLLSAASLSRAAPVDFQPVVGVPHAGVDSAVWRDVGVRMRNPWIEAEVRLPACSRLAPQPGGPSDVDAGTACRMADDVATPFAAARGRQEWLTFKAPRWSDDAPWIDLQLRRWDATLGRPRDVRDVHGGTAANVTVTQAFGPFEANASYEVPLRSSPDASQWRTASLGLAWESARHLVVELSGDRAVDHLTGFVDRTATLRLAWRARGIRVSTWALRSFDAYDGPWRAGVTLRVAF